MVIMLVVIKERLGRPRQSLDLFLGTVGFPAKGHEGVREPRECSVRGSQTDARTSERTLRLQWRKSREAKSRSSRVNPFD